MTERNPHTETPSAPRIVPLELADVYKEYIDVLSPKAREKIIPFNSPGVKISREGLIAHLFEDTEIGRSA